MVNLNSRTSASTTVLVEVTSQKYVNNSFIMCKKGQQPFFCWFTSGLLEINVWAIMVRKYDTSFFSVEPA